MAFYRMDKVEENDNYSGVMASHFHKNEKDFYLYDKELAQETTKEGRKQLRKINNALSNKM